MTGKDKIAGRCPFCGGKMEEKHGFYGGLYFYCGVRLPAARGEQLERIYKEKAKRWAERLKERGEK